MKLCDDFIKDLSDSKVLIVFKLTEPSRSYSQPATLLKKRFWHRCFPVNFAKFLRTPFVPEHLRVTAFVKIMRFARFYLLLASNSIFMTDSQY